MLLDSRFPFAGASLLSLGSSSALYEYVIACAAVDSGRHLSAVHLVDTDTACLHAAAGRFRDTGVGDLRLFCRPADEFVFEREYDIALFLSLYHHYDRLGPRFRARAVALLGEVGRHCRALFFETGQSDDTAVGSERWPLLLDMATAKSPAAWIESRVPEYTGYDAFRTLGRNPCTNRHLYVFWRRRPLKLEPPLRALVEAGEASSPLPECAVTRLTVELDAGGVPVWSAAPARHGQSGSYRPPLPLTMLRTLDAPSVVVDCRFTLPDMSQSKRGDALARVAAALMEWPLGRALLCVHDPAGLESVPAALPVSVDLRVNTETARLERLAAAAYAGIRLGLTDARGRTARVRRLADELGLQLTAGARLLPVSRQAGKAASTRADVASQGA
jgi:hypothetical protein